jgi:hypothetical protein
MVEMPKFLRELMNSDAYTNKNNPDYKYVNEKVAYYMNIFYPGEMHFDATGRAAEPEYDMTKEEFDAAQQKLDDALDEAKAEAEDDAEEQGIEGLNADDYVELEETIPVRVLYPDGTILLEYLEVYNLDVPENYDDDEDGDAPEELWVWDEGGECEICEEMAGTILESEDVPSPHPNCQCTARRMTKKEYKELFGEPDPKKQEKLKELYAKEKEWKERSLEKEQNSNDNFDKAMEKTFGSEGGYTDGKNQVKDQPTNMGIQQGTLNEFNKKFPDKNFPKDVKDLSQEQARAIYKSEYWDNTKIPNIENDRIRNAAFDMNVMSYKSIMATTMQKAINAYSNAGINVDGDMGIKTIKAINAIPNNKVSDFMDVLKSERMESLKGMKNWPTAQKGWTIRTMAY